jgi:hypothetical protein
MKVQSCRELKLFARGGVHGRSFDSECQFGIRYTRRIRRLMEQASKRKRPLKEVERVIGLWFRPREKFLMMIRTRIDQLLSEMTSRLRTNLFFRSTLVKS